MLTYNSWHRSAIGHVDTNVNVLMWRRETRYYGLVVEIAHWVGGWWEWAARLLIFPLEPRFVERVEPTDLKGDHQPLKSGVYGAVALGICTYCLFILILCNSCYAIKFIIIIILDCGFECPNAILLGMANPKWLLYLWKS